jgi:acetolactate synthase I/II/III large subunit
VDHGRPPAFSRDAKVIRVDAEPAEIDRGRPADIGIVGSPRAVLEQLAYEAAGAPAWHNRDWLAQARQAHDGCLQKWADADREDCWPLSAMRICREIKPFLDRDVTFLLDGGNIGRWAHMLLFDRHPAHWLTCGASGVVGWGIPGAVAAKLARPEHPLLLLSGDGAAGFTISEIETALRFGVPYVAVIADDAAWGIVADQQQEGRRVATQLGEIRFDRVAEALGARGVYIEHAEQLRPSIERAFEANTVTVIHVPTQLAGVGCWEARFGCA